MQIHKSRKDILSVARNDRLTRSRMNILLNGKNNAFIHADIGYFVNPRGRVNQMTALQYDSALKQHFKFLPFLQIPDILFYNTATAMSNQPVVFNLQFRLMGIVADLREKQDVHHDGSSSRISV